MTTRPFARFEWMIAWRYLRARRAEGGVSVMTWISLVGIMLAVAALIITLAVRAGFRAEFVDTILGANAHVTVYSTPYQTETGATTRVIAASELSAALNSSMSSSGTHSFVPTLQTSASCGTFPSEMPRTSKSVATDSNVRAVSKKSASWLDS